MSRYSSSYVLKSSHISFISFIRALSSPFLLSSDWVVVAEVSNSDLLSEKLGVKHCSLFWLFGMVIVNGLELSGSGSEMDCYSDTNCSEGLLELLRQLQNPSTHFYFRVSAPRRKGCSRRAVADHRRLGSFNRHLLTKSLKSADQWSEMEGESFYTMLNRARSASSSI